MLTFKEMANPVFGWRLERLRDIRALSRHERYWEVSLLRLHDGKAVEYNHPDLQSAWEGAVRAAENHDVLNRAYLRTE